MTLSMPTIRFCHLDHPLRPPEWRWLRAANLWDQGREPSAPWDDAWVRKALGLYRVLQQDTGDRTRQKLVQRKPALYQAYRLYNDGPSLLRWEVEARLLTNEPFEQIAAKCGTTAKVINAYEKVFFNVRDRLEATGYLINVVLDGDLVVRLREDNVGTILKLYAFGGGVAVLETVLDYFRHPPVLPERPELLAPDALKELRYKLLVKSAIVARTLPPNARVFRKLTLLDEARAAIDPDGGEAAFPSLQSPPLPMLMSYFGEGVGSATSNGKPTPAPIPAEPDPGRLNPPCPNAQPISHSAKGPAQRQGRQKVAVA
jgi:hypothetical protein